MVRRQTWQARHFRIESNRNVRFEFESNLEASQVPIKQLHTLLISLYFQRSLRYRGRKGQKWSKIRIFFELLAHPVETPWPTWMALCQCVRRSVPHTRPTTLDDTQENRNGRRLSCYRRQPQNWYYVTHFLAHPSHPVEPRERWVHTHATVGQGMDKEFFRICLYASIYNGCRDTGT